MYIKELEQNKEYILYSRTIQNGILRDKKLRHSYYDRQRKIILLTRSDITEIREEKRQKELYRMPSTLPRWPTRPKAPSCPECSR
ncbi:MAG: hypothetical protein ACLTW9_30780 [Enterocloster sp.]